MQSHANETRARVTADKQTGVFQFVRVWRRRCRDTQHTLNPSQTNTIDLCEAGVKPVHRLCGHHAAGFGTAGT